MVLEDKILVGSSRWKKLYGEKAWINHLEVLDKEILYFLFFFFCALKVFMDLFHRQLSREIFMAILRELNSSSFSKWQTFFYKSNSQECKKFLDILSTYEKCSEQQINENKTTIFFSKSTLEDGRKLIKEALGRNNCYLRLVAKFWI